MFSGHSHFHSFSESAVLGVVVDHVGPGDDLQKVQRADREMQATQKNKDGPEEFHEM